MRANYQVQKGNLSRLKNEIVIKNFHSTNVYLELPIIKRESYFFDEFLVGFWKVKKLKV